jgi:hypothetical protein
MNTSLEDKYIIAEPLRHQATNWPSMMSARGAAGSEYLFAADAGTRLSVGTGQSIAVNVGESLVPDLFGHGRPLASTQLSVLDFEAARCGYGEASDEFHFQGFGRVRSLSCADRDVRLRGFGQVVQGTPILRGFKGQVFVNDVEGGTWPAVVDVYNVEGVVAGPTQPYRAKYSEPSRAYKAFKELGEWLNLSDGELAKIIEVSRTTVTTSWRNGKEPRKHVQARRLFQLHSVTRALHGALGESLVPWLEGGTPTPLAMLRAGHYGRFERLADEVIFSHGEQPQARLDAAGPPQSEVAITPVDGHRGPRKRSSRVRSRRLRH